MSQLSDTDLKIIAGVGNQLGIRLPAVNLHDLPLDYPRRREILMAFEATNRSAFARMSRESQNVQPMTAEAELARRGLVPMTKDIHEELMSTDADYIQGLEDKAIEQEQGLLASLDRMTAESQRKRLVNQLGSEAAADRAMFAEEQQAKDKAKAAQLAADRDRALQKRIADKRAEIQRGLEQARASATGVMPQ